MIKKRIVIADDHASIRQMLAIVFRREGEYEIVGEAGNGLEALEICRDLRPDVLILDVLLPELCGMEVIKRLREEKLPVRVLFYSGLIDRQRLARALKCRPHGMVQKEDTLTVLRDAVRLVANGGCYFTPFAMELLTEIQEEVDEELHLTHREMEVLQMIAESYSSKQIATRLGVAPKTVENHRQRLMEKLHLHDIAALTRYAIQHGFVEMK